MFSQAVNFATAGTNCAGVGATLAIWDSQESINLLENLITDTSAGRLSPYNRAYYHILFVDQVMGITQRIINGLTKQLSSSKISSAGGCSICIN